jgi:hypothetical protein
MDLEYVFGNPDNGNIFCHFGNFKTSVERHHFLFRNPRHFDDVAEKQKIAAAISFWLLAFSFLPIAYRILFFLIFD